MKRGAGGSPSRGPARTAPPTQQAAAHSNRRAINPRAAWYPRSDWRGFGGGASQGEARTVNGSTQQGNATKPEPRARKATTYELETASRRRNRGTTYATGAHRRNGEPANTQKAPSPQKRGPRASIKGSTALPAAAEAWREPPRGSPPHQRQTAAPSHTQGASCKARCAEARVASARPALPAGRTAGSPSSPAPPRRPRRKAGTRDRSRTSTTPDDEARTRRAPTHPSGLRRRGYRESRYHRTSTVTPPPSGYPKPLRASAAERLISCPRRAA